MRKLLAIILVLSIYGRILHAQLRSLAVKSQGD